MRWGHSEELLYFSQCQDKTALLTRNLEAHLDSNTHDRTMNSFSPFSLMCRKEAMWILLASTFMCLGSKQHRLDTEGAVRWKAMSNTDITGVCCIHCVSGGRTLHYVQRRRQMHQCRPLATHFLWRVCSNVSSGTGHPLSQALNQCQVVTPLAYPLLTIQTNTLAAMLCVEAQWFSLKVKRLTSFRLWVVSSNSVSVISTVISVLTPWKKASVGQMCDLTLDVKCTKL